MAGGDSLTVARAALDADRAREHQRWGWTVGAYLGLIAAVALGYLVVFLSLDSGETAWFAGVAAATVLAVAILLIVDVRGYRLIAAIGSQLLPIAPALLYASAFSVDAGFMSMLTLGLVGAHLVIPDDQMRWRVGILVALVVVIVSAQFLMSRERAWSTLSFEQTAQFALMHRLLLTVGLSAAALVLAQRARHARDVVSASLRLANLAADTDALTGLPNRRPLRATMSDLIDAGEPFAVAVCDVDHFKTLNDTYGHDCGDETLRHVARAMVDATREGDVVGRWGGEEFVSVLRTGREDDAVDAMERVRSAIAASVPACSIARHPATVSIGVATWDGSEPADAALARADRALYEAKRLGRNRVVAGIDAPAAEGL